VRTWIILFSTLLLISITVESFAENDESNPSSTISPNHPGEWHLGENLKVGNYFEYEFTCTIELENCDTANIKFWIRDRIQHENYTSWDAIFLTSQNMQKIRYDIEMEEYTLFPTSMPDGFHKQGGGLYHSLIWLAPITVAKDKHDAGDDAGAEKDVLRFGPNLSEKVQLKHDPKRFADPSWGRHGNWLLGGEIVLQGIETIPTPAGTFDAVVLEIEQYRELPNYDSDSKTWIADEFPFPVKGESSGLGTDRNYASSYVLQNYKEDLTEDLFYAHYAKDFEGLKSPRHQLLDGVDIKDIICKLNLRLIYKVTDNSPACVKLQSMSKLIERGWGEPIPMPEPDTGEFRYGEQECHYIDANEEQRSCIVSGWTKPVSELDCEEICASPGTKE